MRVGFLVLCALCGCYERGLADGATSGADGECVGGARPEPQDFGPIGQDEIPAWVDGRSTLVEDGAVSRCVPEDPESDEQYGCREESGRCVPTPERVRIANGMMIVSLGARCANPGSWSGVPEFRIDGAPVAPNRVLWAVQIAIPVDAIEPGETIELWDTPCAWVAFRMHDWVEAEADACGHDPLVSVQGDGTRTIWCRDEWRLFRADVGADPGLLAHSRVAVSSAAPAEGDTFGLMINVGGCGPTELAMVSGDGSSVPMICCSGAAEHWAEWTVGPGGSLDGPSPASSFDACCYGAEPDPDPHIEVSMGCGEGDPGWW